MPKTLGQLNGFERLMLWVTSTSFGRGAGGSFLVFPWGAEGGAFVVRTKRKWLALRWTMFLLTTLGWLPALITWVYLVNMSGDLTHAMIASSAAAALTMATALLILGAIKRQLQPSVERVTIDEIQAERKRLMSRSLALWAVGLIAGLLALLAGTGLYALRPTGTRIAIAALGLVLVFGSALALSRTGERS
jgi:hypothetical protein